MTNSTFRVYGLYQEHRRESAFVPRFFHQWCVSGRHSITGIAPAVGGGPRERHGVSDPTPPQCENRDCFLFRQLLGDRRLGERSRRQLNCAILHSESHDGAGVVIQRAPGVNGRWDVLYAGAGGIKDVIVSSMTRIFPSSGGREGRTSGR